MIPYFVRIYDNPIAHCDGFNARNENHLMAAAQKIRKRKACHSVLLLLIFLSICIMLMSL